MIIQKNEKYSRVLAIGDIHGCARHLEKLLAAIKPTRDDLIVTLGDYVDRGPDSKGVIDTLLGLHQDPEINIVSLRGNHDALMLMCLLEIQECKEYYGMPGKQCDSDTLDLWWMVGPRESMPLWVDNSALATLCSFCRHRDQETRLGDIELNFRHGRGNPLKYQKDLRDIMAGLIPEDYKTFLRDTCCDALETDDFIFVHGGLCPDLPLADQPLFALHWKRFDQNLKPHISGKKVVCGHTLGSNLLVRDLGPAVCLDTGAFMSRGFLTCMDVLSGQCWQIDDNLQLIQQPVVHYENRVPFIRISELPAEEQRQFMPCLMGRSIPFDGCAWPHDYREWWWGKR